MPENVKRFLLREFAAVELEGGAFAVFLHAYKNRSEERRAESSVEGTPGAGPCGYLVFVFVLE